MRRNLGLLGLLCMTGMVAGQETRLYDSTQAGQWNDHMGADIPVLLLHEHDRNENGGQYIAPLLTANRDPFYMAASFHFSALRFRIRGYDAAFFETGINGLPMNAPDDGHTPWRLWGGLNDVMRNTVVSHGLRNSDFSFGTIGHAVSVDTRASRQRRQTQFGYAASNRSYVHRWSFTHSTGMRKNGWAFSFSGSRRFAAEGYTPGTFYDGWSYFIAADKKLGDQQLLSVTLLGAPLKNGRQGPVLHESVALFGEGYNPYWGYQSGKKRNANTGSIHQPVVLITHELHLHHRSRLLTSAGMVMGDQSSTGLDWYRAADPRPDYYRYLPSFQTDALAGETIAAAMKQDVQLQQVNWQKMYDVNRKSVETIHDANGVKGSSIRGLRSHYIVEERVSRLQWFNLNSIYNTMPAQHVAVTAGINFQLQQQRYFKRIQDLLGGEFYVNWNQFAERDFPNDRHAWQHDLDHPDRILRYGDQFGYDYTIRIKHIAGWAQVAVTKNKADFFAAAACSNTQYTREGHVRHGLFPGTSFGKTPPVSFTNHAFKAGVTYKLNGRKYVYLHTALRSKAPLATDVFISPRTRDTQQEQLLNEKITAAEIGYVLNAPAIKLRLSGYVTSFTDGIRVLTFYHDEYRTLVNYAISNMHKLHYGIESGAEVKLAARWSAAIAMAVGRYYYNSRQEVAVSQDNDDYIVTKNLLYTKNFSIPGTPQEAYHVECRYQSPAYFFLNISANYFRQQWLDFNPVRRSYQALQGVTGHSGQWNAIIQQTRLPPCFTLDLFTGRSWRLATKQKNVYRTLLLNTGIANLLNNRGMVTGGYEQMRFDTDTKDINKFPPKFYYAYGLNFFAGLTLRL